MGQFSDRMNQANREAPKSTGGNVDGNSISQQLTATLLKSQEVRELQGIYQATEAYYNNPRAFGNEAIEDLKGIAGKFGIDMPLGEKDKATALEHVGAGVVGALDGVLFDLIPDDLYSSRRTEMSRSIGMWAGILIPSAIAVIGSFGAATPAVAARIAGTGLKGSFKSAMKLGGKPGQAAHKAIEESSAKIVNLAKNYSLPGLALRGTKKATTGVGQILSKYDATANIGERILASPIGQATYKKGASGIIEKASRFAKKGDVAGVKKVLGDVGEEYAPHLKGAVDDIISSGKLGGESGAILKEAVTKFGKSEFGVDDLTSIGKTFLGYKKGGAATTKAAEKFMGSLKEGLKNNMSMKDIVKGLPKARQNEIIKAWSKPESKAEILKLLAENTPEAATSIMTGLKNIAIPAGLGMLEASALGSSEDLEYENPLEGLLY